MKGNCSAELRRAGNRVEAIAVTTKRAMQEAGHKGIVGEGLRKRCCHVCTEDVRCKPILSGLR
jgi:hypothetical protein